MTKPAEHVKPIRCVFLGYLWELARELNSSPMVELLGVGLEPQRLFTPKAKMELDKLGVPVFDASKLKTNPHFLAILESGIDLLVSGAFGQILPGSMIEKCNHQVLNVHTSLLPQYRGGTPIESQIIAGDSMGGITLHWIDEGIDTGAVAIQKPITIRPDQDSYEMLYEKYHRTAADLLAHLLKIPLQDWPHIAQVGNYPLHPPLKPPFYAIDWHEPAKLTKRKVLASGWKEWVQFPLDSGKLVLLEVNVLASTKTTPGLVLKAGKNPVIASSDGALELIRFHSPRELVEGEILAI